MQTSDTERRLRALEATLARLVRVAEVVSTNPGRGAVCVKFLDAGGTVSAWLPVLARKTHRDADYQMPDIGQPVLCLFLPGGREVGFVLGSAYTARHQPPVASQDKWHKSWEDGTWLEYDRAGHVLSGHVEGDVQIDVSGGIEISAGENREIVVSKNQDLETHGDKTDTVGGSYTITVQGRAAVEAESIELRGGNGGAAKGIVQADCLCAFTGAPHPMISSNVKGSL